MPISNALALAYIALLFVGLFFGLRVSLRGKSRLLPAMITGGLFLALASCVAVRLALGDTGEDDGPDRPFCSGARYCE